MIYGYVRVSTAQQNVENQRFEIANFAEKSGFSVDKWVVEAISSQTNLKKRKLGTLLKKAKKTIL
jgi:DNA invertase Pin-like site-specific DNA recombinase